MRRSEKTGSDSRSAADRMECDGNRTLAICPGDLDRGELPVRISERVEQCFSVLKAELDGECLVAEPQEIGKGLIEKHVSSLRFQVSSSSSDRVPQLH